MKAKIKKKGTKKMKINEQERLFCLYFARGDGPKPAALKAGYTETPEISGLRLLESRRIQRRIKRLASVYARPASTALSRLAFGSHSDGIRLALGQATGTDINELDLFCVSELKWSKDGALDIKFYDRLRALELLAETGTAENDDTLESLYRALETTTTQTSEPQNMEDAQ